MKTLLLLACAAALLPNTLQARERILFPSPNKQWSLRVGVPATESEPAPVAIVDAKSLAEQLVFPELVGSLLAQAKVVWSADSKRLAYYHPSRRGGACEVYFLVDGKWTEMKLPALPEPPDAPVTNNDPVEETPVSEDLKPLRWLGDGALVVARARQDISAGKTYRCEAVITISWVEGKEPTVRNVTKSVRKL